MLKKKYGVFLVGYRQVALCCLSNGWRGRHVLANLAHLKRVGICGANSVGVMSG